MPRKLIKHQSGDVSDDEDEYRYMLVDLLPKSKKESGGTLKKKRQSRGKRITSETKHKSSAKPSRQLLDRVESIKGIGPILGRRLRRNKITTASGLKRKSLRLGKVAFLDWMKYDVHVNASIANNIFKRLCVLHTSNKKNKPGQSASNPIIITEDPLTEKENNFSNTLRESKLENNSEITFIEKKKYNKLQTNSRMSLKISNSKSATTNGHTEKSSKYMDSSLNELGDNSSQKSGKELMKIIAAKLRNTKVRRNSHL